MAKRQPLNTSGIFYDSADLAGLKKWFDAGILGGATTNPLILQREGVLNIPKHILKMINITGSGFPISIEIPDSDMPEKDMISLALKYHKMYPKNAVIKIPMDPREPHKAFEVMYKLGQKGVRLNATLGLGMGQLVGAAEALRLSNAVGDNYISLFWGRREEARDQIVKDMVRDGMNLNDALEKVPDAAACVAMTLRYLENHNLSTRVLVSSIRSTDQIEKAFAVGADIVTIPPNLISQWMFSQRGIETVEEFNEAYRSVKNKITLI
ncbi:MAG: CcbR [Candidatus Woesebacteria bacterium GW2011_GWB1_43_14]|uniref:CcbR n=1 Tax=Candidatus Woesebacteria bacterium GW2011_GWB1_43_14 TaxID=1618578 RepID=A0A0G1DMD3_9BACT|nr:MAG: CcbR [Candidatus Woesebacteria bacterium GW2011_GWC1_42_9]KKS98794.1 MAG: CcbR [Candidatus Woesebacteria bacterium GW2011_GWB1_43_14]